MVEQSGGVKKASDMFCMAVHNKTLVKFQTDLMPYDVNMQSNIVALKFLKLIDIVYQEDNLRLINSPNIMHSFKACS